MAELNAKLHTVVFTPSGIRGSFANGTTILQAARALGVDLDSVCGGRGICGRCQVLPSTGEFAKHGIQSLPSHLSAFCQAEAEYKATASLAEGRRLGCHTQLLGDVVIDVPADSQIHKQIVRKQAETHDIYVNPILSLHLVEVPEPNMHQQSGDLQRLLEALEFEWGLTDLHCTQSVLTKLQASLREEQWQVTVAIYDNHTIVDIWPGYHNAIYGLAVDVGSTTIAAHLCALSSGEVLASAGVMNPQIRFGEDLMSRVSYLMMNPGGLGEMTRVVREAVQSLAAEVAEQASISTDLILDMTLVGNPIMHHLFLGINPENLGTAPFALATDEAVNLPAGELNLALNKEAMVYLLPCIAGHVGADAAGVVLSEGIYLRDEINLIVDVGTNAEIILGNRRHLLAASSPTGPAFEGAQISSGQRAAPGAIERVRIDPISKRARFRVIGSELWSDDPEFPNATAETGVTGICGSGIIEAIAEMYLAGIISTEGVIDGRLAAQTPLIQADGRTFSFLLHQGQMTISITQNDIRAVQLAKAALYAGIRILMMHMQVQKVDRIRLAGAFGSHIDVKYAMVLGMVPDCPLAAVSSAGNAAGTGARIALMDKDARHDIETIARRIEKIETAVESRFQEFFIDALGIPHKHDSFPELGKEVTLPVPQAVEQSGERKRRRRSRA